MIKAIETRFKGCHFRSRLEARWAVFFDALGIEWQYEPQGFVVKAEWSDSSQEWNYLPDFYLPQTETWVEIKGTLPGLDYCEMLAHAVDWGGALPGICDSYNTARGILYLCDVPDPDMYPPAHPILQHGKGGWVGGATFLPGGLRCVSSGSCYFDSSCGDAGETIRECLEKYHTGRWSWTTLYLHPVVREAYHAARSARFEHGQSGAT